MFERIADGRTDLVIDWIEQGGAVDESDAQGTSLIQYCAYYGDVSAIRVLVGHGAKIESLGPNLGLNGAAFHGHWRLCQFLLEQGADANNALPDTRETPLHAAASAANRPSYDHVVRLLLAAGADPNARAAVGVATGNFMRDCRTRGETPLHRAAAFATEVSIAAMIAAGGRLDATDSVGDTPLSWASWHQRPSAILRLLCQGDNGLNPDSHWTGDHGAGGRGLDAHLVGTPRARPADNTDGET